MLDYDVVIAGAGIGGSALAGVRARALQAEDPSLLSWFLAVFAGPDAMPPSAFESSVRDRLLAPA